MISMQSAPSTSGTPDATAVTPSGRRLGFLDVLRGIAALGVFIQHLCEASYPRFKEFSGHWLNLGAFGVVLFFLISGFIIPASIEKHSSLLRFWRGRLFRLYPMYIVAMIGALLLVHFGQLPISPWSTHHMLLYLAANLTMMEEYLGIKCLVGISWTLALEMIFYIICSVAFAYGWLRSAKVLGILAIAVIGISSALSFLTDWSIPMGRLGLLATCFMGTLVYRVYKQQQPAKVLWLLVPFWLCLLPGFWGHFGLHPNRDAAGVTLFSASNVLISWVLAYGLFFLFYALRHREFPAILQWFGKISYSFYLISDFWVIIPRHSSHWLWILECFALITATATLTYSFVERPMMLLGSKNEHRVPATA